jgi:hypothetical protein
VGVTRDDVADSLGDREAAIVAGPARQAEPRPHRPWAQDELAPEPEAEEMMAADRMMAVDRRVSIFFSDIVLLLACLGELGLMTGRVSRGLR